MTTDRSKESERDTRVTAGDFGPQQNHVSPTAASITASLQQHIHWHTPCNQHNN